LFLFGVVQTKRNSKFTQKKIERKEKKMDWKIVGEGGGEMILILLFFFV